MTAAEPVTLALAPTSRGLGFIAFAGETRPLDWGVKEARGDKNARALVHAGALMARFAPAVLVLEDARAQGSRRAPRIRRLIDRIGLRALARGVALARYPKRVVRARFAGFGSGSKDDRAAAVAAMIPELAPRLPKKRRLWDAEHPAMGMFEAAALALTHFAEARREREEDG